MFARLARLSEVDYDRARAGEAKRLGIKVSTLDAEVGKRRAKAKTGKAAPPPPKQRTLAELESAASDILTSHTVLDRFAEEIGRRVAGEVANLKRLYLGATTRLFDKAMHTAIKGLSASGKSEIRLEVLSFIPPEDVISFTTLSEKALLYMPDDFAHKVLSMGEAAGVEQAVFPGLSAARANERGAAALSGAAEGRQGDRHRHRREERPGRLHGDHDAHLPCTRRMKRGC